MNKKHLIVLFIFLLFYKSTFALYSDLSNFSFSYNTKLYLSIGVFSIFFILMLYIFKIYSKFNSEHLKQFQKLDSNKMEELRLYVLVVGLLAPISEYFIWIYDVRNTNELDYNIISGIVLVSFYFASKKNIKIIKISYYTLLFYFFSFFGYTSFKLFFYKTETIHIAEFFICLFFAYYLFYKLVHYYIFILLVMISNLFLFYSYELTIESKIILFVFSFMIMVLNHLRQIIYYKQQERLFFINNIVNSGLSMVIASDKNQRITYISENVKDILGYTPNELLGNGWWEKTIDDKTEFENTKLKLYNEIKEESVNSRLIKTKSGDYKWLQFQDKKFNEDLYYGIGNDITEIKKLELEKLKQREKLQTQQECLQIINKIQFKELDSNNEDLNEILKIVCTAISIDDVSIIEYKDDILRVVSCYDKNLNTFTSGEEFSIKKYPIYKDNLKQGKNILVSDTRSGEFTFEFQNEYIKDKNIKSLADIPIFIGGSLKFIFSCKHTEKYYEWDNDDINFLKLVAEILTLIIENKKRREAEKLAIESENIFRQINETIDNVFFLFDLKKSKIIYISPSCKDILGIDQNSFYGKYDFWTNYIHNDDLNKIYDCHKKLVLQGFYEVEYRIIKNGEIRWIEEKSYGIQDNYGNFVKSSGICTDITENKKREDELKKLSLIAERTTNGVSITDKDGKVLWVNKGYLDMFEIEKKQLIGKIPREIFIKDNDELLEEVRSKNGSNYKIEFEITTFKGNNKWIEVNNNIIIDENGEFIQQVDVITDITERVLNKQKLETQSIILEEYTKDLEYQNKLKEKLIQADNTKDVVRNTLMFLNDQFDYLIYSCLLFPDSNFTRYTGFSSCDNEFFDESFFATELLCLDKVLLGEIFIKEDLTNLIVKTQNDINFIEKGVFSYLALPIQNQNDFLGLIIVGFSEKLNLSFKQITYLKDTASVVGVTLNQIRLKDILQNKNEDILSSILYAKNIQTSLFTNLKKFSKYFKNVSIFYRPKDIVSGDFYWGKETDKFCFIAMGDCTGHGVPGAFITLLGINFLEQLIGIENRHEPSDILNQMDLRLTSILKNHTSSEDSLYEGMELALCVYEKSNKRLLFSGAGLGILYFYNNEEIHIRGQRGGIGEPKNEDFTYKSSIINITGHEYFYLATDGYQDQLGGERSKRFSKNRLITLLNEIKFKDAEVQEKILSDTMDKYIGNYWQLDDYTVIGFSIHE